MDEIVKQKVTWCIARRCSRVGLKYSDRLEESCVHIAWCASVFLTLQLSTEPPPFILLSPPIIVKKRRYFFHC